MARDRTDPGAIRNPDDHPSQEHDVNRTRPAAVAGYFYPRGARELHDTVAGLLAGVAASNAPLPKAIVAPHAGYVYSGPIAASVYAQLAPLRGRVSRVVLLGPAHRVWIDGLALPGAEALETPLGTVPVNLDAANSLRACGLASDSPAAHAQEHSLEVQLPFLQALLGEFSVVPLVVGDASSDAVAEIFDRLWGGDETLLVASSDLSHYLPYRTAQQADARTARAIVDFDAPLGHDQACGATVINGLLALGQRRGLSAKLIDLRNSGDTAGDKARVVGYGAFAFTEAGGHE